MIRATVRPPDLPPAHAVRHRLAVLSQERCSDDLFFDLYGVQPSLAEKVMRVFQAWSQKLNPFGGRSQGQTHRGLWERFLVEHRIIPRKLAAARVGMTVESWNRVTPAMLRTIFVVPASLESEDFVPLDWIERLGSYLSGPTTTIYSDHNAYCAHLHRLIRSRLHVEVDPLYCETSLVLRQSPTDYAYEWDVITGEGLGIRHAVWINTAKPLHLRPDACGKRVYAAHPRMFQPYLFAGHEPDIPAGLGRR
ncbi:MAG TPA: hypothetical protein VHO06_15785 [Polyangia bacterium]|nr:hypothetical protein [Polyangia bacterium]